MPVILKSICLVALSTASFTNLTAQNGDITKTQPAPEYRVTMSERPQAYLNSLNIKAIRNFKSKYPEVIDEAWSVNNDCYRVTFKKDSVVYRVDYTLKGEWRNTCRQFDESKMPENLRGLIKSTFYDYEIVTVTELIYQKKAFYFVKIEDKHTLKTIRVLDGEMEIVEAYKKQ